MLFSSPLILRKVRTARIPNSFCLRTLSTEISADDIKRSLEKAEKFIKFNQVSITPKSMTDCVKGLDPAKAHLPANPAELAALSGMPAEHQNRTVIIQPRTLKTQQQGIRHAHQWQLSWKPSERWSNPLMGWTSSADPFSSTKLLFDSAEDAVEYAKKSGWKYDLKKAHDLSTVEAGTYNYSQNFLPQKTIIQLQDMGPKNTIFANPKYGQSNWFPPLSFHGDKEAPQHGPKLA